MFDLGALMGIDEYRYGGFGVYFVYSVYGGLERGDWGCSIFCERGPCAVSVQDVLWKMSRI